MIDSANAPVIENMELYISVNHLFNHQIIQVMVPQTYLQIHMSKTLDMNEEQLIKYLKSPRDNRILSDNHQKELQELNQNPWVPSGSGLLIVDHDRTQVIGVCANFGLSCSLDEWRSLGVLNYFRDYPEDWQTFQAMTWEAKRKIMDFKSGFPKCVSVCGERLDWESILCFSSEPKTNMLLNYQVRELTNSYPDDVWSGEVMFKQNWLMGFSKDDWDFSRVLDASKTIEEWSELLPEIMPVLLTSELQFQKWSKWTEELTSLDYSFVLNEEEKKASWLEMSQHTIAGIMRENLLKYSVKKVPQHRDVFAPPSPPKNLYRF